MSTSVSGLGYGGSWECWGPTGEAGVRAGSRPGHRSSCPRGDQLTQGGGPGGPRALGLNTQVAALGGEGLWGEVWYLALDPHSGVLDTSPAPQHHPVLVCMELKVAGDPQPAWAPPACATTISQVGHVLQGLQVCDGQRPLARMGPASHLCPILTAAKQKPGPGNLKVKPGA